jgi:hypothetical protein
MAVPSVGSINLFDNWNSSALRRRSRKFAAPRLRRRTRRLDIGQKH